MIKIKFEQMVRQAQKSNDNYIKTIDMEELKCLIGEAELCDSFKFFNIECDWTNEQMIIPDDFDAGQANQIIECYQTFHEQSSLDHYPTNILIPAWHYDEMTAPKRGADDGTFDYAGSFPSTIFEILEDMGY